jgi:hypothetical protein
VLVAASLLAALVTGTDHCMQSADCHG